MTVRKLSISVPAELEETIALPGLKMFFIAMTDASKVITRSKYPDWDNKKLWEYVARAVKLGEKHGVMIGANTSYAYTMAEMRGRVRRLHEARHRKDLNPLLP